MILSTDLTQNFLEKLHAFIRDLRHLRAILSHRHVNIPKRIQNSLDVTYGLLRVFYTCFNISDSQNACKCTTVAF